MSETTKTECSRSTVANEQSAEHTCNATESIIFPPYDGLTALAISRNSPLRGLFFASLKWGNKSIKAGCYLYK